jgi:hypothetical protein
MTNRVAFASHDFQRMCKQAERDHESKKLLVLMQRVKQQIAQQKDSPDHLGTPRPPLAVMSGESGVTRLPSRPARFER